MKRSFFIVGLLISLSLVGCSSEEPSQRGNTLAAEEPTIEPVFHYIPQQETQLSYQTVEDNLPSYYHGYSKNPQVVDDSRIQEVGVGFQDENGTATVKALNTEMQEMQIGPIQMKLWETKVIHFQPDESIREFYFPYTLDAEFDVVKVFIELVNTGSDPVAFSPIEQIITSGNVIRTWKYDIYIDELNGILQSGEIKKGNFGVIIENPEMDGITIKTGDVLTSSDEKIAERDMIQVNF